MEEQLLDVKLLGYSFYPHDGYFESQWTNLLILTPPSFITMNKYYFIASGVVILASALISFTIIILRKKFSV